MPEERLKVCDLASYLSENSNKPFQWGENDCCTFAIGWLEIRTGKDYLAEHRPWRTARQAAKKLRDLGGLFFLFQKHLQQIDPNMAQDGDLTIFNGTACIFSGRHVVSVGVNGLEFVGRESVDCAWTHRCRHF